MNDLIRLGVKELLQMIVESGGASLEGDLEYAGKKFKLTVEEVD